MTAEPPRPPVDIFGGRRGFVDSGVPPVVFVAVNAWRGLDTAVWAALACAVVLFVERMVRRKPVRYAVSGFLGIAIAAAIARRTGEARGFFLPGIVINSVYCVGLLISVLARAPAVGWLLKQTLQRPDGWHELPAVRRAYAEVTIAWAALFGVRAVVQGALYALDRPGWLAAAKLAMGWPLFILFAAATLPWVNRRAHQSESATPDP